MKNVMHNNKLQAYKPIPKFLVLPTTNCQASCSYCFGPHYNGKTMESSTLEKTAQWMGWLVTELTMVHDDAPPVFVVFHGGEPLLAGHDFFKEALEVFKQCLEPTTVLFSVISNLWLFDDEYGKLFRESKTSLAFSIDGPEEITDAQRGAGYYKRAMQGYESAKKWGLNPVAVCTFTRQSAKRVDEVFEFFSMHNLDFQFKVVVPDLDGHLSENQLLSSRDHVALIDRLIDLYLQPNTMINISSIKSLFQSLINRQGGSYIAGDCLGKQIAISPEGEIYHCQRFVGHDQYRLSHVDEMPSFTKLSSSRIWQKYSSRIRAIETECAGCHNQEVCKGGCPYNALTKNNGSFNGNPRDILCEAYDMILDRLAEKISSCAFSKPAFPGATDKNHPEQRFRRFLSRIRC